MKKLTLLLLTLIPTITQAGLISTNEKQNTYNYYYKNCLEKGVSADFSMFLTNNYAESERLTKKYCDCIGTEFSNVAIDAITNDLTEDQYNEEVKKKSQAIINKCLKLFK